jgi:hypothetical protein
MSNQNPMQMAFKSLPPMVKPPDMKLPGARELPLAGPPALPFVQPPQLPLAGPPQLPGPDAIGSEGPQVKAVPWIRQPIGLEQYVPKRTQPFNGWNLLRLVYGGGGSGPRY